MNTLKTLLKTACGKQVLVLMMLWVMCLGIYMGVITSGIPESFFLLILTFLVIWTIGYLFFVASNVAKGNPKPLQSMPLASTFILGFWVSLRLIFIFSLLILIEVGLAFFPSTIKHFRTISLTYIVLVVAPYMLFIVSRSDKMPWIKGLLSFFKKNASHAFAFIFWATLSVVIYSTLANYLILQGSSDVIRFVFSFVLFALSFWLLTFDAVLLGFFTKRAIAFQTDAKE